MSLPTSPAGDAPDAEGRSDENLTLDVQSPPRTTPDDPEDPLLLARARMGLWVVLIAIAAFAVVDGRLAGPALHATRLVRLLQFTVIGLSALGFRIRMRRR